jgi:hypothetical protein
VAGAEAKRMPQTPRSGASRTQPQPPHTINRCRSPELTRKMPSQRTKTQARTSNIQRRTSGIQHPSQRDWPI